LNPLSKCSVLFDNKHLTHREHFIANVPSFFSIQVVSEARLHLGAGTLREDAARGMAPFASSKLMQYALHMLTFMYNYQSITACGMTPFASLKVMQYAIC
jgi:hypothetical protein